MARDHREMKQENKTFADENTTEEEAKEDYRKIANGACGSASCSPKSATRTMIKITDEEVTRAIVEQVRQMPGREQQVWDFYRKNPNALAELRAPIFEEKVVDFLLALAKVTEKTVSKDELYKRRGRRRGCVTWTASRSERERRFKLKLSAAISRL